MAYILLTCQSAIFGALVINDEHILFPLGAGYRPPIAVGSVTSGSLSPTRVILEHQDLLLPMTFGQVGAHLLQWD